MPKKHRRNGFNQNNNKNGINKKHYQKGQYNDRKPKYIAPHLINDALDEDLEGNENRKQNFHRNDNQSKRKIIQKFDKMTVSKETKKLAIGDDDSTRKTLLPSIPHCRPADVPEDVFNVIVKFLQDYFTCYDTNRDNLLAAYNPKVLFSMSVNASNSGAYRTFKFDDYIKESRNLRRVFATDDYSLEKRYKLLHQGHIDTVNFLRKLPPTEHDPATFKLDQCYFRPNMVTFSVVGVFKEGKPTDKVRPIRSFQRTFVCIPDANTTMSIINELYVVGNVSTHQYRAYFKDKNTEVKKDTNATTSAVASAAPTPSSMVIPDHLNEQQKQMVLQLSSQTSLNYMWSHDCLQQVGWNFEAAAKLFVEYRNQLPADAFVK